MHESESPLSPQDSKTSSKRTRKILNCEPCRNSKLKCDRNRLCSSCVLRGHASLCYSVDDKDASTSMSEAAVAPPESPFTTLNPSSEFRKIRQSLFLLEFHVAQLQQSPAPPLKASVPEARAPRSAGGRVYSFAPSWPSRPNLGIGPTSWVSYLGFKSFPDGGDRRAESSDKKLVRADYERDNDLIRQLPSLTVIDGLIDYYFEYCNWIHRHVNEPSFTARWTRYKAGDFPCRIVLATVCMIVAISLHHLPEAHELLAGLPVGREELGIRCYHTMRTVMARRQVDSSMYSLDLVELLLVRAHYLSLFRIDSEEIWHVKGELVSVAMALGLHRDPGTWGLSEALAERRRWAWWHVVFLERWNAFVFGRPISFSSQHFDTQLPSAGDSSGDHSPRIYTANVALFRLGQSIGEFMNDATSLRPVPYGTILDMDRLLQQWLDGLPVELNFDDLSLIRSVTSPVTSIRRLSVQSLFLRATFLHVRFALHRAHASGSPRGDSPEMSASMNIAVDAADKLTNLAIHVCPESLANSSFVVLGHMCTFPFHLFSAAMFLAFLLIDNPEKVAFQSFRGSVGRAISGLNRLEGRPFVARALSILQVLEPLYSESYLHDSPPDRARKKADALARVQLLVFSAPSIHGDSVEGFDAAAPVDVSMASSPSPSGPWEQPLRQDPPSTTTSSVSSLSPSLPWASVGIRNVLDPYASRKRLRSQPDVVPSSSLSAPATSQAERASSFLVPPISGTPHAWRRPSAPSHAHSYQAQEAGPSTQPLNSFVQEGAEDTYKILLSDKESMWGASIGFERGELGQFFDDMEDGTT